MKYTYQSVTKLCEERKVKLKWNEKEFKEKYKNTKTDIEIYSSCGHLTKVQLNNLIHQNTGVICKDCVYENFKNDRSGLEYDTHIQEYQVLKGLQNYCTDLSFKLTDENCLVDFAIKPIEVIEDLWLPIQLKTSAYKSEYIYKFNLKKQYKNIVIILFYINSDNMHKIWLLNGNDIIITNISISHKNSIYDIYEIGSANLSCYLKKLYYDENYKKVSFAEVNIPISLQFKQEQEFKNFREKIFPNFNYQYPECNGRVYDVIINKFYKVQDKVITITTKGNNTTYSVALYRNHNKSYNLGDNDYYWLFLPDKRGAYIISENDLYNNNIITNDKSTFNNIILYPYSKNTRKYKTLWMNEYLYFFDNLNDMKKIELLFDNTDKNEIIDNNYIILTIKDTYIEVIKLVKNIVKNIINKYDKNIIKNKNKNIDIKKLTKNNDTNFVKFIINKIFQKVVEENYVHDMLQRIFQKVINQNKVCKLCNEYISCDNISEVCIKCTPKYRFQNPTKRKVERSSYEQLKAEVQASSYVQVGKKYGVSDNAIRKWIKMYEKYES